ncbi:hypothetical protein Daesc_010332 [Daldinia eschscholtzii]|uniref:Uncharacterized protein n=1 Tax=Daldinia eschscholtzii TaxID=292717 RepID=A0AAX6M8P0_9PEZI
MGKLAPVNPRNYMPSRAHPEHRSHRKQLEKEHPFTWKEPLVLGLIGIGLAWNIEKQVQKREERKEQEGRDNNNSNNERRRRREQNCQDSSYEPSSNSNESRRSRSTRGGEERWSSRPRGGGGGGSSDYSVGRDTVDLERTRRSRRRDRVQSVDMGRYEDPRYIDDDDEYYEQSRYDRGYYDDSPKDSDRDRDRDWEHRGRRSRRDSW